MAKPNIDKVERVGKRLKNILREFTDGAVIIGFTADGDAFVTSYARDAKTAIALNAMTSMLMHSGGVQFDQAAAPEPPPGTAPEVAGGD